MCFCDFGRCDQGMLTFRCCLRRSPAAHEGEGNCTDKLFATHGAREFCHTISFEDEALKNPSVLNLALSCLNGRPEITAVDLSSQFIRRESSQAVGKCLASQVNLEHVDLHNNALGKEGVEAITYAIMRHPRLKSVSFAKNFLDASSFSTTAVCSSPATSLLDLGNTQ